MRGRLDLHDYRARCSLSPTPYAVQNWTTSPSYALDATNGRFLASVPVAIVVAGLCFSAWGKWGRRAAFFRGAIGENPAGLDPAAALAQAG
ncbi:hypothetical protein [Streptomyces sp. NPDC001401]|uniref:hypothetical protein n=1 Tax=Streptomyces sp. NPDC001401 TaxID=3364570 RepID=UPI0036CF06B1